MATRGRPAKSTVVRGSKRGGTAGPNARANAKVAQARKARAPKPSRAQKRATKAKETLANTPAGKKRAAALKASRELTAKTNATTAKSVAATKARRANKAKAQNAKPKRLTADQMGDGWARPKPKKKSQAGPTKTPDLLRKPTKKTPPSNSTSPAKRLLSPKQITAAGKKALANPSGKPGAGTVLKQKKVVPASQRQPQPPKDRKLSDIISNAYANPSVAKTGKAKETPSSPTPRRNPNPHGRATGNKLTAGPKLPPLVTAKSLRAEGKLTPAERKAASRKARGRD